MDRIVKSCIQAIADVNKRRGGGLGVDRAESIRLLRERLGLSQRKFSDVYEFDLHVLKSWEAGRRSPDTANILLLSLISLDPEGMADRISRLRSNLNAAPRVSELA